MNIREVRVRHAARSIWGHLAEREKTLPLVTPLDIYPGYQETRGSWFWDSGMAVVEIEADDGTVGRGWCEDGCQAVAPLIENHLRRLLIGTDPFEVEGIWDRLFRGSLPYGRKGMALQAISAIDIALWDLLGQVTGKAVCELLGGPVRESIPAYASALHPVGTEKVREEASAYVNDGFTAMKMRFPYGPGEGVRGMAANEEHVANVREAVGEDVEIMADAYMGWDFHYAKKMCRRLEEYRLAWLEEPFLPDDLKSYAKLRKETSIPISGGEHEYTRFGFLDIIEKEAMDVIQPDLRRCGGFTEGKKIAALAASAGVSLIPHAYGVRILPTPLLDSFATAPVTVLVTVVTMLVVSLLRGWEPKGDMLHEERAGWLRASRTQIEQKTEQEASGGERRGGAWVLLLGLSVVAVSAYLSFVVFW